MYIGYFFRHNAFQLNKLWYNVNIIFMCTGKQQKNCATCFIELVTLLQLSRTKPKASSRHGCERDSVGFREFWPFHGTVVLAPFLPTMLGFPSSFVFNLTFLMIARLTRAPPSLTSLSYRIQIKRQNQFCLLAVQAKILRFNLQWQVSIIHPTRKQWLWPRITGGTTNGNLD